MIRFFRLENPPVKFSYYQKLSAERRKELKMDQCGPVVEVLSFCLMPNHFHFLLRQTALDGIKKFTSNFQNSYSKYFNIKRKRTGSLFQSMFKGVRIEDDEQLLHVCRYIHLNPTSSFIVPEEKLEEYPWFSYLDYIYEKKLHDFITTNLVLNQFKDRESYKNFVIDQIDYQRQLDLIKHLILE
jgi:putative transposase